jgi:hypothetical protein
METKKIPRKEFFTKSCQCGMAAFAGLFLLSNDSYSQSDNATDQSEIDKLNKRIRFSQQRFSDLIQHLDNYLDKETRLQLYRNVGESCACVNEDSISEFKGNLKGILDEQLKQNWLKEFNFCEEKGELKLAGKPKEECGCPLVKKGLTPVEFCNCSVGYMKKFYEIVTEKTVETQLDGSILMGDDHCSFTIRFS